ncbi:MAG: M23 family metallopeptidase [Acidobacteriota bacterium]|nr:M23 family metallopeptidase [Acidobacteriota bacterium]
MLDLLFLLLAWSDAHTWNWPMTTEYGVTAGFGEYRGSRFHMGLDFSTNDLEGEQVRAARDGRVYQIKARDNGYGRVIYVRHQDGYATVYAHLAAFGPKLTEVLKERGLDPLAPFGDIALDVPVSTEDLLAYSGESGAGTPHLHFEVRKRDNPVSPLDLDFPPLPKIANRARIKEVLLAPLDRDSRVNGSPLPFLVGQGVNNIRATGRIGVYPFVYISTDRGNRIAARGVKLYQDERLVGSWQPLQLSFDNYRHAGLVYDQAWSGFGPTRYAHCFDDRAADLPKVPGFQQDGVVVVNGPTQLRIQARNLAGDWFTRVLDLNPKAARHRKLNFGEIPVQATSLTLKLHQDRIYLNPGLAGTLHLPDSIQGLAAGDSRIISPATVDKRLDMRWRTPAGNLERAYAMLSGKGGSRLNLGPWSLRLGKGVSLPDTAAVLEPADPKLGGQVLAFESPVLHFGRNGRPVNGTTVRFDPGDLEEPQQVGIYTWSFNKGRWRFLETLDKPATFRHLTPLVAARDLSPPVIGKPRVHPYFSGERVVIPMRDRGSGIDANKITVTGPEGRLKGRWDGDRRWVVLPKGQKRGPWSVTVSDRAGLTTSASDLRR